jgi:membrane protein
VIQIPVPLRLAWVAFKRFHAHSGPDRAAAVAYYALLSLLPMLVFAISVGMAVAGSFDAAYNATVFILQGVVVHMDATTMETLRRFVEQSVRFKLISILVLAWTARRSFNALFSALETVFEVPGRGFAGGNLVALAMVIVTGVGMLLSLTLTTLRATFEGIFARYAPVIMGDTTTVLHRLLDVVFTHLLPIAFAMLFFFTVYRIMPRRTVSTRDALIGALLATILWESAKSGFAYYIRNLTQFAGLYGTLEGLIVLALWLELSVSIILYCGEVVAVLIRRRNGEIRASDVPTAV